MKPKQLQIKRHKIKKTTSNPSPAGFPYCTRILVHEPGKVPFSKKGTFPGPVEGPGIYIYIYFIYIYIYIIYIYISYVNSDCLCSHVQGTSFDLGMCIVNAGQKHHAVRSHFVMCELEVVLMLV